MSTLIMGNSLATVEQMRTYIKKINPNIAESVINMIPLYLSEGNIEGVRGDIAFAQSCLETGNFTFKGSAVTLDQNNFAGIGVTSNGMKGNSWDTPQLGIRAQIQHLKAYASDKSLVNECVDPRFKYVTRKSAEYVEWLGIGDNPNGKGWASGSGYGSKILKILDSILAIKVSNGKSYGELASELAIKIANDDTHGYDQTNRQGPDYDCSSLIINIYEEIGIPLKSNGANTTWDVKDVCIKFGFKDVTSETNNGKSVDKLISGDILLNPSSHMEMYVGNGKKVGAHINEKGTATGGQTGDQTGHEIDVSNMYGTWEVVLRPPTNNTNDKNEENSSSTVTNEESNTSGGKKMRFNVHAGHNYKVPGASGCFSETSEDRKVKDLVISKLRSLGHTVYDCTDDAGTTSSQNLANIVAKCNSHDVDLDVSIHFNAFNGVAHGTEVFQYDGRTNVYCQNVVNEIAKLGFTNRGVKNGAHLYVIRNTNARAILIECCFCDNAEDARLYNAESMATAIVKGLTGSTVSSGNNNSNNSSNSNNNTSNSGSTNKTNVYKVIPDDEICIYDGPGPNYNINGTIKKDDAYTIVETQNGFGKLKSGAGWVNMQYMVNCAGNSNNSSNISGSKYPVCPFLVKINTEVLRVRKGPSTDTEIVTTVKQNYNFTIKEVVGNWGRLKSDAGYICLDYCIIL